MCSFNFAWTPFEKMSLSANWDQKFETSHTTLSANGIVKKCTSICTVKMKMTISAIYIAKNDSFCQNINKDGSSWLLKQKRCQFMTIVSIKMVLPVVKWTLYCMSMDGIKK